MKASEQRCGRSLVAIAWSVALVLSTSACVTDEAPPAASPSVESSPSAEPADDSLSSPISFLDVECADLVSSEAIEAALGSGLAPVEFGYVELAGDDGPLGYALRQLNGLECHWSNGQPNHVDGQENPAYAGVVVRVAPNAEADWAKFAEYYTVDEVPASSCSVDGDVVRCSYDTLDADRWIQIISRGSIADGAQPDQTSALQPMSEEAISALRAASPSGTNWQAPKGTVAIESSCDELFSAEEVQSVLGLSSEVFLEGIDGGVSLSASAWYRTGGRWCPWVTSEGTGGGGNHSWLPGGEWAWQEELEELPVEARESLPVIGLTSDDSAYIDCATPEGECSVDLVVGHNWIEIEFARDEWVEAPIANKREVLTQLAATTVATLRS